VNQKGFLVLFACRQQLTNIYGIRRHLADAFSVCDINLILFRIELAMRSSDTPRERYPSSESRSPDSAPCKARQRGSCHK